MMKFQRDIYNISQNHHPLRNYSGISMAVYLDNINSTPESPGEIFKALNNTYKTTQGNERYFIASLAKEFRDFFANASSKDAARNDLDKVCSQYKEMFDASDLFSIARPEKRPSEKQRQYHSVSNIYNMVCRAFKISGK